VFRLVVVVEVDDFFLFRRGEESGWEDSPITHFNLMFSSISESDSVERVSLVVNSNVLDFHIYICVQIQPGVAVSATIGGG
jgi:hypothetical protein